MFSEYKDILTISDVSEMLGLKPYRIYELLKSGRIRRLNTGKPFLIPKTEVIRFVESSVLE